MEAGCLQGVGLSVAWGHPQRDDCRGHRQHGDVRGQYPIGECLQACPRSSQNAQERQLWVAGTMLVPAGHAGAKCAGDSPACGSGRQPQPEGLEGGGEGSCLCWKNWWDFAPCQKTH